MTNYSFIYCLNIVQFSSVQPNSLRSHGLQYAWLPCPSPTPGAYSNSVHWVGDAIQSSHPLLSPSPPAFKYCGLFWFCLLLHRLLFWFYLGSHIHIISTQMVSTIIYKLMCQRVLFLFLIWTHIYNCLKESLLACPKDSFNAPCSNRIHYHLQTCSSSRFLLTITSTSIYSGAQATYLDIMLNSLSLNPIGYLLIKCFFIFYYYYLLVFGVLCFLLFIFNWSIIALQCYVGFCHTSVWIIHRYTSIGIHP